MYEHGRFMYSIDMQLNQTALLYRHYRYATHFPGNSHHKPDFLDIALVKLTSYNTCIINLTALSSNHNQIILTKSDLPITTSSPSNHFKTNWKQFEHLIAEAFPIANLQVSNTSEINSAISYLSRSIIYMMEKSSTPLHRNSHKLPIGITEEI